MKRHRTARGDGSRRRGRTRRSPRGTGPYTGKRPRPPETSWGNVAGWYDNLIGQGGSEHHTNIILPGVLRLLGSIKGRDLLDLACGQGVLCRSLGRAGARVTGMDASPELIDRALARGKRGIRYIVADVRQRSRLPDASFSGATCVMALQNIDPFEPVLAEAHRLLERGGRLVIVISHPCFRIARQSGWGWDEKRRLQYRRVDHYLTPLSIPIEMHPGKAPGTRTWTFHRPLSLYVEGLVKSGFAITALEEWTSHRKSQRGPHQKAEDRARRQIPLFLALRAEKRSET